MTDVLAVIPARSGSKSVTDKNITSLGGYPLIAYSIAAAQMANNVQRVMVSTDSQRYAQIAKAFGADVPFLRPDAYSTDTATDRDFLLHAMKWMQENEKHCPEYWVHLRPTTPLRDPTLIDEAIIQIKNNNQATSLRSGHKSPESPFKWFQRDEQGYFKSLTEDDGKETYNLPKEHFPAVYIPDGYVDVVRASHILNQPTAHGQNMIGFMSPVCTEVDSPEELDYIRYQMSKNGSAIYEYLNKHYKHLEDNY